MQQITIVLIDKDETYLQPVWNKFYEELQDRAKISMITESGYIETFFSTPRKIDILLINEEYFNRPLLQKHDIANIFILSEQMTAKPGYIYKYTSVKEIYDYVASNIKADTISSLNPVHKTKLIVFYTPVGGCGTTTVSHFVAQILSNQHKTLYVSTEDIQSVYSLINCDRYMDKGFEQMMLSNDDDSLLDAIKAELYNDGCDYLLPVRNRFSNQKPTLSNYVALIKKMIELQMHDYIVVDTSVKLDDEKCALLGMADKVIILSRQDRTSVMKIDELMGLIDCSNQSKYIFICNMYNENYPNYLDYKYMKNPCIVREYIKSSVDEFNSNTISENGILEKTVSLVI